MDPAAAWCRRGCATGRGAAAGAGGPYVVRGPERGDRLPDGRGLADALARAGVPRLLRPFVPVVCDGGGAPLWAPGVAGTSAGLVGDGGDATPHPVRVMPGNGFRPRLVVGSAARSESAMVLIILGILGVPLWLLIGALGAGLLARKRFAKAPGVFRCKVRNVADEMPGLKATWPRRALYARWVHDVLLVHKGLASVRTLAPPGRDCDGACRPRRRVTVQRLGDEPVSIRLVLDSGAVVELAADAKSLSSAVSPSPPSW